MKSHIDRLMGEMQQDTPEISTEFVKGCLKVLVKEVIHNLESMDTDNKEMLIDYWKEFKKKL